MAGCLLHLFTLAVSIAAGVGAWYVVDWAALGLRPFLPPAIAEHLPLVAAAVWVWGTYMAIYVAVPGWYRGDAKSQLSVYRFACLLPLVILGRGRRGLGIAGGNLGERLATMVLLCALLCTLTWMLFRYVDGRRRMASDLQRDGPAK